MRIAVINETSAAHRNGDILAALAGRGHEVVNAGMTACGADPELTYIHTGLLAGLLLGSDRVDLVVGGCGTGQGFLNSAMQYPGVFCGLLQSPLDGWLFAQINGGNCLSLALNFQYGWAADVNLRFLFDRYFSVEPGCGYPEPRKISQRESRERLAQISGVAHRTMAEIVATLPDEVVRPVLSYPGVLELLDLNRLEEGELRNALQGRLG